MKTKIAYWLLAHFPRPVAVFYAMLVQLVINNIDNFILAGYLVCIFICYFLFGTKGAAVFLVVTLGGIAAWVFYDAARSYYKKFDEALPKREKKVEEE